jgi:MoxR-like ATPase
MSDKPKTTAKHFHPLEESVLSLAAGKLHKVEEAEAAPAIRSVKPEEPASLPEIRPRADMPPEKLKSISHTINECIRYISKHVIGREQTVRQTFIALLTGEHQLLISRTGMAKSLLARQIFACFEDAQVFEKQLTKDTMPENLFGAYDIEAMKKGKMIHNVEGSIVLSHFAFLDEIFDANDMLLRSLLSLLNEKQLVNGEQIVNATLHSAIAAANYVRYTEVLEAVIDRFLYKSFLPENKDLYFQYSIDQIYQQQFGKVATPQRRLSMGELSYAKKVIQSNQVAIPGYVLFLKNYILKKYIEETRATHSDRKDFTVSDRKSVKMQDTLRAVAFLDGREEVDEQDLDSLFFAVCTVGREEEIARLAKITAAARNYFRQDRDILDNMFNAIDILNIIRSSENQEMLRSDTSFNLIRTRLQEIARAETSRFKEYFTRLKTKIMSLNRDTFLPETFAVLENISEVSMKNVGSRECRELVVSFRQAVFEHKKYLQL